MNNNPIVNLLGIQYPIIQAGMIWCSNWELASAVSNAGGLGTLGAGSMYPDVLKEQILNLKQNTNKPFAVNLPLLYPEIDKHIDTIIDNKVPIVITSAGNPNTYTQEFKKHNIKVLHVVSNLKFALKAEQAGVNAIIAEGFEAGGHNGKEETTTLCLIPNITKHVKIPVIAAGGIATGKSMLAVMILGASGVQIGTRFVMSTESSAHINFKNIILDSKEGDTKLSLKQLVPVRLLNNQFYKNISKMEEEGLSISEIESYLGKGRAKKGMYEGDLIEGELEIGQVSANIDSILPASTIISNIVSEYHEAIKNVKSI